MKRVIFGTYDFLAPVIFWSIFLDLMDRKMARSNKVVITNAHAKEFLKSVHNEALFSLLFARASTSVHIVTGMLTSKLFGLISSF